MSIIQKGNFSSYSGERLYCESRSYKQRATYQNHFIFVHGALSHSRGQVRFLEHLVAAYKTSIVSSFDFSGHGRSSGRKAFTESIDNYTNQLSEFIKLKKQEVVSDRIILIGYSMGGLVSLDLLERAECDGPSIDLFILINPCLKLGDNHLAAPIEKLRSVTSLLPVKLRLPVLAPASSLTNDEAIIQEIEMDSLRSSYITVGLFTALYRKAIRVRLRSVNFHPPLLFLISGADVTVKPEITRVYSQGFKSSLCTVKYYKYAKHDLLNEVNRCDVFRDIDSWIEQTLEVADKATK